MVNLRREPALIIGALGALLALIASLPQVGGRMPDGWDGALIVVITAIAGAWTAARTRPLAPTAFTYLATVVVQALALWNFHVPPATVGAVNVLIIAVVALVRGQITPAADPAPTTPEVGKVR